MKQVLIAVAFAFASMPAMAQTAPQTPAPPSSNRRMSVEQRARFYTDEQQQKLALNQDQYAKLLAINTECIRRKDALKAEGMQHGDAGFKEIAAYRRQQYMTILTPDQMAQLKAMNAERRNRQGNKMAPMPNGASDDMPMSDR